jgi:hypothetical protein
MLAFVRLAVAMAVGSVACGCSFAPGAVRGKSPLSPFKPGVETSALEIVFVRHPYELTAMNDDLWREIDETQIESGVRQALAQNGFRVGVIGGTPPLVLETTLASDQSGPGAPEITSAGVSELTDAPLVRRRMLYALPGQRSELLTSGIYDRLPLLVREANESHGKSYNQAQCVLAARATPLGDQRVRVELVPEVQFGEPRREVRSEDGVLRFDASRPKVAFDRLTIEAVLSPGQTLVFAARPELPGSMGHYFFTEPSAGQLEQKLLLIRFQGSKYDNLMMADGGAKP